jgi:predicted nucleic acid-binding protein
VMSALPVIPAIPPEQAVLFVEEIRQRMTLISLTEAEYFSTIKKAAEDGFRGGRIYDALLLACAEKSRAAEIYTWNLRHFQAIAPHLSARIRNP